MKTKPVLEGIYTRADIESVNVLRGELLRGCEISDEGQVR